MGDDNKRVAKPVEELKNVVVRFAGDSGDGMQTVGNLFADTSALIGNDISTFPDYPAEIRAPAGSLPGVSGFQLNFSSMNIRTPGDAPDVLVAMNPAGLKVNLADVPAGGTVIVNGDAFTKQNLQKAAYKSDPLTDGSLDAYRLIVVPLTTLNREAVKGIDGMTSSKDIDRCKNFFALGIMFWLYDRPLDHILAWIDQKFGKKPSIAEANKRTLKGGHTFAEATELLPIQYQVKKADIEEGTYRKITGNEGIVLGLLAASHLSDKGIFYGSYPITPASSILEGLARYKNFGIKTFQAEDEIAAVCAAIGASFAGKIGVTGTSGPGLALKSEGIGLAVMTELPLVVINVQRGGPSTGLPTKTEQGDLLQALWGRNSECPVAILAPATPTDCFYLILEAIRIAMNYMVPVIFMSDAYLASSSEPFRIPAVSDLQKIKFDFHTDPDGFAPYLRNPDTLARPWAIPGTPGLEHRIGGLEKEDITGNVNYDPHNHQKMVETRQEKINRIADIIPKAEVFGDKEGDLLVLSWGSSFGAVITAVERAQAEGFSVSSLHLRYLNPFPKKLASVLKSFKRVLIPEMNMGQLAQLIRARFLIDTIGYNKVQGQPFHIAEIVHKIEEIIKEI